MKRTTDGTDDKKGDSVNTTASTRQALVFYAPKEPNKKNPHRDQLNYYRFENLPKSADKLEALQTWVGGGITIIPHRVRDKAPYICYANDSGLVENLRSNDLAKGVLGRLGFLLSPWIPLCGTVVLLGNHGSQERGLNEKEKAELEQVITLHRKEWYESEEEDSFSEEADLGTSDTDRGEE